MKNIWKLQSSGFYINQKGFIAGPDLTGTFIIMQHSAGKFFNHLREEVDEESATLVKDGTTIFEK